MQDIPDKSTLLTAVQHFLQNDLASSVTDRALRFRLLIAANVLGIVTRELALEARHLEDELMRLAALGVDAEALDAVRRLDSEQARRDALSQLYGPLLQGESGPNSALFGHIKATLADKLAVTNPRFDLSATIE